MQYSFRIGLFVPCLFVAFGAVFVFGQQGSVTFKHFRQYAPGQWDQRVQAFHAGAPVGDPQRTLTCSSPLSRGQAVAVTKAGNDSAPMCSMKVLKDEEQTAEYEQVCNTGVQEQVIHSTMRALDDRTISTEVRNSIGGRETSLVKITSRYVGPCPPGVEAPPVISMPRPTPELCVQVPEMRRQVDESLRGCAGPDTPESARASCTAAMQRLANSVQRMESQCR